MHDFSSLRTRPALALAALLASIAARSADGHWSSPQEVPVERLVTNLNDHVQQHPDDAQGHYLLGRVHGLAFVLESRTVAVWSRHGEDPLPVVADDSFQDSGVDAYARRMGERVAPPPDATLLLAHLCPAVHHLERALELEPHWALAQLGLAYVLEKGRAFAGRADCLPGAPPPATEEARQRVAELIATIAGDSDRQRESAIEALSERMKDWITAIHEQRDHPSTAVREAIGSILERWWEQRAIELHLAAFEGAFAKEAALEEQPIRGLSTLVSYEAGAGFLRLTKPRGSTTDEEREQIARVEAGLEALESKPRNFIITPIICSLEQALPLQALLAERRSVTFDLDGDGAAERWPWVRPATALLVWDPGSSGSITSGRQLFGTATWWMLFSDGYQALRALDDDRDGWLAGDELDGIAVWHDRDGNGVSDAGEVTPAAQARVEAIAVEAAGVVDGVLAHPGGIRLRGGRALPTYDWVTSPCPDAVQIPDHQR